MTSRLTPKQRIEAYQYAVNRLQVRQGKMYMCCLLEDWINKNSVLTLRANTLIDFPELKKQQPIGVSNISGIWYPGNEYDKRIEHLQIAIKNVVL